MGLWLGPQSIRPAFDHTPVQRLFDLGLKPQATQHIVTVGCFSDLVDQCPLEGCLEQRSVGVVPAGRVRAKAQILLMRRNQAVHLTLSNSHFGLQSQYFRLGLNGRMRSSESK